jgi:hypothetical protein
MLQDLRIIVGSGVTKDEFLFCDLFARGVSEINSHSSKEKITLDYYDVLVSQLLFKNNTEVSNKIMRSIANVIYDLTEEEDSSTLECTIYDGKTRDMVTKFFINKQVTVTYL